MPNDPVQSESVQAGVADDLAALSEGIEAGEGLPTLIRAAARALGGSVALIDRSSAVLAVAAASPDEETKLLSGSDEAISVALEVAGEQVGELRIRRDDAAGAVGMDEATERLVFNLLALELERSRSGDWASEEAAGDFVRALLVRDITDRRDITARAADLGADLNSGGGVVMGRVHPKAAQSEDWRSRALTLAVRGVKAVSPGALVASAEPANGGVERRDAELIAVVPTEDEGLLARAARSLLAELEVELGGFTITVGRSRLAADPTDLHRAGQEARLALNVGEAEGSGNLAFEETGSYRLLLPAMSEAPGELQGFYSETVEPLAAYDEQYETELLATLEAYLENDGNVARTAERMFTHRHTIRYRLERARELCGHDATSTEGREKLGLGLKAMRVLGIAGPGGPAREPGTEAGSVSRKAPEPD
jgi:DNA-binding PucR family transcriptional regulator